MQPQHHLLIPTEYLPKLPRALSQPAHCPDCHLSLVPPLLAPLLPPRNQGSTRYFVTVHLFTATLFVRVPVFADQSSTWNLFLGHSTWRYKATTQQHSREPGVVTPCLPTSTTPKRPRTITINHHSSIIDHDYLPNLQPSTLVAPWRPAPHVRLPPKRAAL